MATTGEIIWAQLIARKPDFSSISLDSEFAALDVELPHRTITIRKAAPLRDFYLKSFSLTLGGSNIPVRVFLLLQLISGKNTARSFYRVELNWIPTVTRIKSLWKYVFSYDPKSVTITALVAKNPVDTSSVKRKVFLYAPRGWFQNRGSKRRGSWTPRQILNLALRSGVLRSGVTSLRTPFPKVYNQKSSPSNNPVQRFTPWILAGEGPFSNPYTSQIIVPGYESFFRSQTSVNTPGFKRLKKSELPVNPYSLTLRKTYDGPGMDRRINNFTGGTFSSTWCRSGNLRADLAAPAPVHDVTVLNTAVNRLIKNIADGAQGNIALNIAQSNLIGKMLVNTASRIVGSVSALRKGNFPRAISSLMNGRSPRNNSIRKGNPSLSKSLANNWLELQYGWKPLLSDIEGALHSYAQYNYGSRSSVMARSSAHSEKSYVLPLELALGSPLLGKVGHKKWTDFSSCRFGVRYRLENAELALLAQTGFTNPINLVWELLPWSFVVDWFLPIGPYLESLSGYHGLVFDEGFRTQFLRQTTVSDASYTGPIPGEANSTLQYRIDFAQLKINVDRVRLTAFPRLQFPQFRAGLSGLRVANAIALVRQVFK